MRRPPKTLALVAGVLLVASLAALTLVSGDDPPPSFRAQACGLPSSWLERTVLGYHPDRSGQIALLPTQPAYMQTGGGGWSHSGPWPYLQDVPLVFYGPGVIPATGEVDRPVTVADIAPTMATLMRGAIQADGSSLPEVAEVDETLIERDPPRLIVNIVWDGGGWNVLENWPGDWENLLTLMEGGVNFTSATVGSSPSVTPAVHTTLGTGFFPATHGVTGVPVRDEEGVVVDSFNEGDSSRFIETPTLAERWDEQTGNRAKVAMVGYEPWHLGMIGQGAEREGGDKDHALWLDTETNEWITNPDHYSLPVSLDDGADLLAYTDELDLTDGEEDDVWEEVPLDDRTRLEETPAFIRYHGDVLERLITEDGYGKDGVTDLIYTNFKQIDRLGHYFNFDSPQVNAALLESDEQLGRLVEVLDREVGRGGYVVIVTADHGQQPDAPEINGFGIDPREVKADIDEEFGPITRAVWPTEVFLLEEEMAQRDVTVAEVARFLSDYRLADNDPEGRFTGSFGSSDRLFDLAIPAHLLTEIDCASRPTAASSPSS